MPELSRVQLLALWRLHGDLQGAPIASLRVDGEVVPDVAAAMQRAQLAWEVASNVQPPYAELDPRSPNSEGAAPRAAPVRQRGPLRRFFSRLLDRLGRWVEQLPHTKGGGRLGRFLRWNLGALTGGTTQVVRPVQLDVALSDGTRRRLTARVVDLEATRRVRQTEARLIAAGAVPVPLPIVGNIYGISAPILGAFAAAGRARAARRADDVASAKAYDGVKRRQRALALNKLLPGWASVVEGVALISATDALRNLARPVLENVVHLGTG